MAFVMLCALLEDNGRYLFLAKPFGKDATCYGLPCVLARESDDPVQKLTEL